MAPIAINIPNGNKAIAENAIAIIPMSLTPNIFIIDEMATMEMEKIGEVQFGNSKYSLK